MNGLVRTKLSVMMFLEFFIWGAWLPLIFGYLPSLGFNSTQQSWILNAFALASFAGMFFSNQFADRNFAAEKFLAFSQFVGGVAILGLFWVKPGWHAVLLGSIVDLSFWSFFLLMLVHCLFYVPTISITNSIAFANLRDPQHDFGPVRLWGTIGWIAASWPFVFILADWAAVPAFGSVPFVEWLGAALGTSKSGGALQEGVRWTFVAAGLASLLLAAFSLMLPHTPPKHSYEGAERFAWLEAMRLLRVPFVLVLFVVTFFDAAVHQCYFIWTNDYLKSVGIPGNWVMPVMSIGQIAEIGTMAVLGTFLKRLGWRTTMVIGILGHALRFGVFALAPFPWLAALVNVLHGICYAFFFATVYIFVDAFFPKDARSSAQGLFNFLILGLGPFVANFIWPFIGDQVK
jgi:MFS family permease